VKAFLIFRDRVTYGRRCADAMTAAGLEPVIVDHGSTWPAAIVWLAEMEQSGYTVLLRGGGHPRSLWDWEPFTRCKGDERYVVTDPDVVPSDGCPQDWPERLGRVLDDYPGIEKTGLGLRIDNLPACYSRRDQVVEWEKQFWEDPVADGLYHAPLDTTLSMYRAGSYFGMDAYRTGTPYVADHLAWHEDLDALPAETLYYYEHAEQGISHWAARGYSAWGN
jgi:hypothetical protein